LKTVVSYLSVLIFVSMLLAPSEGRGSGNISVESDARFRLEERGELDPELHLLGLSLRHTFADRRGDRLILFGLARAEQDLSEVMLHELYARYKGSLGSWDLTAGRFRLPYGLMYSFDAATLLYDTPHEDLLGMDSDNGVMISGIAGPLDYSLSITQGYGHHSPGFPGHGIATARLGIMPGDTEEITIGISGAYGKSSTPHHGDTAVERALTGADATLYLGRWLIRIEMSAGTVDGRSILAGFAGIDYALMPGLDMNLSSNILRHGPNTTDTWLAGLTWRPRWLTIRGGYRYVGQNDSHGFTIQAYHLFSRGF